MNVSQCNLNLPNLCIFPGLKVSLIIILMISLYHTSFCELFEAVFLFFLVLADVSVSAVPIDGFRPFLVRWSGLHHDVEPDSIVVALELVVGQVQEVEL